MTTRNLQLRLDAVRGDSFDLQVTVTDDATGLPVDITGWTLMFTVKRAADDAADDDAAAVAVDVTAHTDAVNGLSTVSLSAAQTAALLGVYAWDLQARKPDGTITTVVGGHIEFARDVTRRTEAA